MEKNMVRILVVDDEEEILQALQIHLELEGYYVETANSADKALSIIDNKGFHIVLTDINMPKKDGIELLEAIKQKTGDAIVIMITAYTSMMKVLSSRLYGATDFILKPFGDLTEVDRVIDRAYQQIQRWEDVLEEVRDKKHQQS